MGQAAVGAGCDVQQVEAAGEEKVIEDLGRRAGRLAGQRILLEECGAHLFVGLEHTPGEQGAHVQLGDPGLLEDGKRQAVAQLRPGQLLGLLHEVILVLEGREPFQKGDDAVEGLLDGGVVGLQGRVGGLIGERMAPHRPLRGDRIAGKGWGSAAASDRLDPLGEILVPVAAGATPGRARCQRTGWGSRTAGHLGISLWRRRRR